MQKHRCHKFPNNRKVVSFTGNYPRPQVGLFFSGLGQWGGSGIFKASLVTFWWQMFSTFFDLPQKIPQFFRLRRAQIIVGGGGMAIFFGMGAEKNSPN